MEDINSNKYNITFDSEYNYSINTVWDKWIDIKNICPNYQKELLKLVKIKNPYLIL